MDELTLDHCFRREVSTSPLLRNWLIGKTKFAQRSLDLVTDEKWHQRWYRDPETKKDSETDILLMFRDASNCELYALHIENKTAHRKWEPNQAENYRKRATNRMRAWRCVDFQTILLAPSAFVCRHPAEATSFDVVLVDAGLHRRLSHRVAYKVQRGLEETLGGYTRLYDKTAPQESHPKLGKVVGGENVVLAFARLSLEVVTTDASANEHRGLEKARTIRQHQIIQYRHRERPFAFLPAQGQLRAPFSLQLH